MNWKDTKNPNVKLGTSSEFIQAPEISQNCRNSYETFIMEVDTENVPNEKIPMKGDFYAPIWSYVDHESKAFYKATFKPEFGFGVMKMPESYGQDKSETTNVAAATPIPSTTPAKVPATPPFKANTPKSEASLGIIAEEITNIRKLIEILAEKKADQLMKPASEMK